MPQFRRICSSIDSIENLHSARVWYASVSRSTLMSAVRSCSSVLTQTHHSQRNRNGNENIAGLFKWTFANRIEGKKEREKGKPNPNYPRVNNWKWNQYLVVNLYLHEQITLLWSSNHDPQWKSLIIIIIMWLQCRRHLIMVVAVFRTFCRICQWRCEISCRIQYKMGPISAAFEKALPQCLLRFWSDSLHFHPLVQRLLQVSCQFDFQYGARHHQ